MSKQNKANKSNYVQAGRLTPDDMARERGKMRLVGGERSRAKAEDEPARPRRAAKRSNGPATGSGEEESSQGRSGREE